MKAGYIRGSIAVEATVVTSSVGIKGQLVWARAQRGVPRVKNG
jgi:hypothetical protein